jgi:hypothetical protein
MAWFFRSSPSPHCPPPAHALETTPDSALSVARPALAFVVEGSLVRGLLYFIFCWRYQEAIEAALRGEGDSRVLIPLVGVMSDPKTGDRAHESVRGRDHAGGEVRRYSPCAPIRVDSRRFASIRVERRLRAPGCVCNEPACSMLWVMICSWHVL